jgi:hypothetical protein
MFYLMEFRSHYTSEMGSHVTFDPESASPEEKPLYEAIMQGKSAPLCVRLFQNSVWAMARRVLDIELKEATTPEAISYFETMLKRIPNKRIIPAGRGTQSTDILFDD